MRSEDFEPPEAVDGRQRRPAWQIWAIVGGAAALVALVGIGGIIFVARSRAPERPPVLAPVDQLRGHLPVPLKPGDVCAEADPAEYATATVACQWPDPHVPRTASYSLFTDETAMHRSAMTVVRGSGGFGPACAAAEDFNAEGGQIQWRRDERERGTLWCFLNGDQQPVILWTDSAPRILAWATAASQDQAGELLEWFHREGQASLDLVPATPHPAPTANSPGQTSTDRPSGTAPQSESHGTGPRTTVPGHSGGPTTVPAPTGRAPGPTGRAPAPPGGAPGPTGRGTARQETHDPAPHAPDRAATGGAPPPTGPAPRPPDDAPPPS